MPDYPTGNPVIKQEKNGYSAISGKACRISDIQQKKEIRPNTNCMLYAYLSILFSVVSFLEIVHLINICEPTPRLLTILKAGPLQILFNIHKDNKTYSHSRTRCSLHIMDIEYCHGL